MACRGFVGEEFHEGLLGRLGSGEQLSVTQDAVPAEAPANPTGKSGETMALQSCLKLLQGAGLVTPH